MTVPLLIMAVLHLRKTYYSRITNLADRILKKGIYVEIALYTTPTVLKADFEEQLKLAVDAVALVEKGGDKADRKKQINLLYALLRKLLNYVNGLYEGDEVKLLKSGFDVNSIATPHAVPDQLVIKKIVKGNLPNTIKIMLEPLTGTAANKKERKTYIVFIYANAETTEYKSFVAGTNSRSIIVDDVPVMTTLYYSIIAVNASGPSLLASKVRFTLTD